MNAVLEYKHEKLQNLISVTLQIFRRKKIQTDVAAHARNSNLDYRAVCFGQPRGGITSREVTRRLTKRGRGSWNIQGHSKLHIHIGGARRDQILRRKKTVSVTFTQRATSDIKKGGLQRAYFYECPKSRNPQTVDAHNSYVTRIMNGHRSFVHASIRRQFFYHDCTEHRVLCMVYEQRDITAHAPHKGA